MFIGHHHSQTERDLIQLLQGRPRAEANRLATRTWHIRTPAPLHSRVHRRAQEENLPDSALVRKAVDAYLASVQR